MEYRNIKAPLFTEKFTVHSINHVIEGKTFVINLQGALCDDETARITFKSVLVTRYTPLKTCISEYCEKLHIYVKDNPDYMKDYTGIIELVDCDELKNKSPFAKPYGFKHYLILTEDEYVEVLAEFDPLVEVFDVHE